MAARSKVLAPDGVLLLLAGLLHLVLQLPQIRRSGLALQPHVGGGLVNEVDGLVGQAAVADIAHREGHGGVQGPVGDFQLVVGLVAVPNAPENGHGGILVRLGDDDALKPPLQGGILLNILAVLLQRGGADDLELPRPRAGLMMLAASMAPRHCPRPRWCAARR